MNVYRPVRTDASFDPLFDKLCGDVIDAPFVDTGHWQAKKGVPMTRTRELLNVILELPIAATPGAWASWMRPNLPWAEDHFQERISGIPYNPPPSHVYWPFNQAGNKDHMNDQQPVEIDERDWVHLACLIDGEGCITFRKGEQNRPQIAVSQKDGDFLREVYNRFNVGHLYDRKPRNRQLPTGTLIESRATQWHISSTEEMMWVLENIIPHLILKRGKAKKALAILQKRDVGAKARRKFPERLLADPKFSHSYPERLWPRHAGGARTPRRGIRYEYGDLNDAVTLLQEEPHTRQCYIPLWGMEDLCAAAVHHQRVPCTLGYHIILRNNQLHVFYPMRSLDLLRYARDDFFMAGRLTHWFLEALKKSANDNSIWHDVQPGILTVHAVSLHVFENDVPAVRHRLEKQRKRQEAVA